jgi:hypothetical protein
VLDQHRAEQIVHIEINAVSARREVYAPEIWVVLQFLDIAAQTVIDRAVQPAPKHQQGSLKQSCILDEVVSPNIASNGSACA